MSNNKKTYDELKAAEKEARKQFIIDAAERVFAQKPHDHVSMKEIAREAGIAVATIYTYFHDQEDLFIESFIRDTKVLVNALTDIKTNGENDQYKQVIDAFINYFTNKDSYFRMMANFMLHGKISADSLDKLNNVLREILDVIEPVFEDMADSPERRYYSHVMFAFLNGLLISFRKYPGRSEQEIVDHMKRLGRIFAEILEYASKAKNMSS